MTRDRTSSGLPCAALAEDRTALVDGALDLGRQELLHAHLVHCTPCRDDVADLRLLRQRLQAPVPAEAPRGLEQRLVSIAGSEAAAPMWSRPFRRTRIGSLTSPRRTLRIRVGAVVVAVSAAVASAGTIGYLSAPANPMAAVSDPTAEAQAEFASMLAQFPLANDGLGAVMSARGTDLSSSMPTADTFPATAGHWRLSTSQARAAMARAASAADSVGYTGVQAFRTESGGQTFRATVEVQALIGQGTRSRVLDRSGQQVSAGFTPAVSAARLVDVRLLSLLESNYTMAAWAGAEAAGRPATLVEAGRGGTTAARWWIDDASGIVLAQQTFDRNGRQVMQVGFTTVQISRSLASAAALPTGLTGPTTDTVWTVSMAPELNRQGWACRSEVARLSLVRLRSDSPTAPQAVQMVYSDGLAKVSVYEQRGQLSAAPQGSSWDTGIGAYVQNGASRSASWQSGDTVFTVVTDGTAELLAAAVGSLPHDPPPKRTTMERISAGWVEILADMKG